MSPGEAIVTVVVGGAESRGSGSRVSGTESEGRGAEGVVWNSPRRVLKLS